MGWAPYPEMSDKKMVEITQEGLMKPDKDQKERYLSALYTFMDSTPNIDLYPDARSQIETIVDMHIDRAGYSPEIAKLLGVNYLLNRVIILTPEQNKLSLMRKDYPFFEPFLTTLYSYCEKSITQLTEKEPVIAEFDIKVPIGDSAFDACHYIKELLSGKQSIEPRMLSKTAPYTTLEFKIETPTGSVRGWKLRKEIELLTPEKMDEYLFEVDFKSLKSFYQELSVLQKNYGVKRCNELDMEKSSLTFNIREGFAFSSQIYSVYILVYSSPLIIYDGPGHELTGKIPVLNLMDYERVVRELMKRGYLQPNTQKIQDKMNDLATEAMTAAGVPHDEISKLRKNSVDFFNKLSQRDVKKQLGREWHTLRDILQTESDNHEALISKMDSLTVQQQLELLEPVLAKNFMFDVLGKLNKYASEQRIYVPETPVVVKSDEKIDEIEGKKEKREDKREEKSEEAEKKEEKKPTIEDWIRHRSMKE